LEAEAGQYKAVIRAEKIENVVKTNAEMEASRRNEFLERQAEADYRMQIQEQEKERAHQEKLQEAKVREEHIKNVLV